jgi:hypothetical protein
MDIPDANASELNEFAESTPTPRDDVHTLDVELATVCMVDGIWQDQPDNVAAFVEARLGDLARGRGNLYICLDISGDIEGRGELERALVEVIRDTYAESRGSVSFGLSEALRAANAYLYDNNRQVQRELRRMAGVSAVVLRGSDLYICQAGPAVVYVEASEKLARFPAESDWFTEDAPLFAPQGAASAPLGIRREFAADLAHTAVSIGDVFVLASRALTQLATTQELAIAFTERSAAEIGAYLEELGQDADVTALVAELIDPHAHADELFTPDETETHIESFPVPLGALVVADASEPALEEPVDAEADYAPEAEPAFALQMPVAPLARADEYELDWESDNSEPTENLATNELPAPVAFEPEMQTPPQTHTVVPIAPPPPPAYRPAPPPVPRAAVAIAPQTEPPDYDAELERRRAARAAERAARNAGVQRALGGVVSLIAIMSGAVTGLWHRLLGDVDWDKKGKQTNRTLNLAVGILISFVMLLVRLVLPGAPASSKLMPRRATSDPVWLKALAIALPILMLVLTGARYYQTINAKQAQFETLLAQADTMVKQAEVNPDRAQALTQLQDAKKILRQATELQDSTKGRALLFRIQDQQNELEGVAIFRFLPEIAQAGAGTQFAQIAATDQDIFLLDRQNSIHHYVINDVSGETKPAEPNAVILKPGAEIGAQTVARVRLLTKVTRGQDKALIVAVTDKGFLAYDLEAKQWNAYDIQDADKWGELRAVEGFNSNLYLLDAQNNQIYKYAATAAGYSPQAAPYFPANAQVNLSKAIDMAIDGDVWVLNDNGIVRRFRSGAPVSFELGALATPLKNPVALYTRTGSDSLYIADAGNHRIVEFDKNGKFVRQFQAAAEKSQVLANLQDLTVNELKRKVYFVNSNAAYLANLAK